MTNLLTMIAKVITKRRQKNEAKILIKEKRKLVGEKNAVEVINTVTAKRKRPNPMNILARALVRMIKRSEEKRH